MAASALVVLDLQRDFLEPGGRMPVAAAHVGPLLAIANTMIETAASRGVPVIYVVNAFPRSQYVLNIFRRGAAIAGTPGAEIDRRVLLLSGAATFPKERSDAFTNPGLDSYLRARCIKHLAIVGVFAPACVRATSRGAQSNGYSVTVVRDGVGAASDGALQRALSRMAADGVVVAMAASTSLD